MNIILYSTHCPKCNVLEKKLSAFGYKYNVVTDEDLMVKKGFMSAPMLEVDNIIMDFKTAIDWVKKSGSNT